MASDAEQASILSAVYDKLEEDLGKLRTIKDQLDEIRRYTQSIKDDFSEARATMILVSEGPLITNAITALNNGDEHADVVLDESGVALDTCDGDLRAAIDTARELIDQKIRSLFQ